MQELMQATCNNSKCTLNICMSYGGIEEILHAINSVAKNTEMLESEKLMQCIYSELYVPEPVDLMVRTGECRLSNFLLFQSNQSTRFIFRRELLWPELSYVKFIGMIFQYQQWT
jgi:undecaprenyl diphosphate synthase